MWEFGKNLGMYCSGDEEEVVKEFERMEERDKETMNQFKEGDHHGYL